MLYSKLRCCIDVYSVTDEVVRNKEAEAIVHSVHRVNPYSGVLFPQIKLRNKTWLTYQYKVLAPRNEPHAIVKVSIEDVPQQNYKYH